MPTPEVLETFSPGLYNRLIQASLESNCWAGLAKALHAATGKGVLIESARFELLAASGVPAQLRELSAARWLDRNGRPGERLYLLRDFIYTVKPADPSQTGWRLVGIIHGEEGVLGYLSLISDDDRGLAGSLILLEKTLPLAVICWWRQQKRPEGLVRRPERGRPGPGQGQEKGREQERRRQLINPGGGVVLPAVTGSVDSLLSQILTNILEKGARVNGSGEAAGSEGAPGGGEGTAGRREAHGSKDAAGSESVTKGEAAADPGAGQKTDTGEAGAGAGAGTEAKNGSEAGFNPKTMVFSNQRSLPLQDYWFCPLVFRLQAAAGAEPEAINASLARLEKILTGVHAQTDVFLAHTVQGEEITVLLGSPTARPAKSFCLSLAAQLIEKWEEKENPAYLHIGIGQAGREPARLKTFLAQAREAALLFSAHCEGNQVRHYEDLAVCHFLNGVNPPFLEDFLAKTVAPLLENRRSRELRLLETLEAYFGCHGNLSRLAKKLFLSRSSAVYRLQLIEQILGVKLTDPLTRLSLQLALLVFWKAKAENILEKRD